MSDLKISDFKKYLIDKDADNLRKELIEVVKLFPKVKEYYETKMYPENEDQVMEKFRKIIKNEFFPDRGFGKLRYSIMKKALSDFGKISKKPKNLAELMISYVEYGVDFTNSYGDIDEYFYENIAKMFDKTTRYIIENNLTEIFIRRIKNIVKKTEGIGWGFHDDICDVYFNHFHDNQD